MSQERIQFITEMLESTQADTQTKVFSRGDFLLREGEQERHIYWIESGAIRAFRVTEFEEQTIRFGYANSLVSSLPAFFSESPSLFYLQAIRKATVRLIPKTAFFSFVASDWAIGRQYQALLQALVTEQIEREIDLLTHSPAERYQRVLERSPQLFQEIPSKYIASYLRMTPETLSRLKGR